MNIAPPPTPVIGRDDELAAPAPMLADGGTRLVTLTGPPGVGKTRLAVEAAARWAAGPGGGAPERVSLADLTAVRDPASVPAHLASVVAAGSAAGEPAVDRIVSAVGDKQYLLVVDNCEHVLDAVPVLATLLARCARLRILATSRERLRLAAEHEYPVPPLAMPQPEIVGDVARLAACPAVALLVERARARCCRRSR